MSLKTVICKFHNMIILFWHHKGVWHCRNIFIIANVYNFKMKLNIIDFVQRPWPMWCLWGGVDHIVFQMVTVPQICGKYTKSSQTGKCRKEIKREYKILKNLKSIRTVLKKKKNGNIKKKHNLVSYFIHKKNILLLIDNI